MHFSNTDETNKRTHTSVRIEGGLGLALGGSVSIEVKTDHRTNDSSFVACLSESEAAGEAFGILTYNTNAKGGVADSIEISTSFSVNGFIGAGALAGRGEYDVFTDKFKYDYGLGKETGIIGVGFRSDISIEACVEVYPSGIFRERREKTDWLLSDEKTTKVKSDNSSSNTNKAHNKQSSREMKDSFSEGRRSDLGRLSEGPLNRFSGL